MNELSAHCGQGKGRKIEMKHKAKSFLKRVWDVVSIFIGVMFVAGGLNILAPALSAHFAANNRIDFFVVLGATLINLFLGFLILRACIRRNERWRYPVGISSILISSMEIVIFFRFSDLSREKTAVEAIVFKGMATGFLMVGLIFLLTALILIGHQIIKDKKMRDVK